MNGALVMVGFCAAGAGFLICFLVGTCKRQTCVWICYVLQPQSESGTTFVDQQESSQHRPLAAA